MFATDADRLTLTDNNAQVFRAAALPYLGNLLAILAGLLKDRAGVRLGAMPDLYPYLAPTGPVGALASRLLGRDGHAVHAIFFDKRDLLRQERGQQLVWTDSNSMTSHFFSSLDQTGSGHSMSRSAPAIINGACPMRRLRN